MSSMPIHYLRGDLFLSRAQTLAHGVNCRGRMGAGIAVEFRRRAPEMFQEYRRRCHHQLLRPGDLFLWTSTTPWILNMATQAASGGAVEGYLEQCLRRLAAEYDDLGITSLAMPRIAAGLGGLPWETVRYWLQQLLGDLPIAIYVYDEFVEGLQVHEP
jgi:O-acetyl-ADP-ribose deacetylase (regulator of RNase III)